MQKIKIILNGEEKFLNPKMTIADLINELELEPSKIAVEKDLQIILPANFENVVIDESSQIEIIHFIGGG